MHPTNELYLLTGPVHSGKTSSLSDSIKDITSIGGFICPDKDGLRYLKNIHDGTIHRFQIANQESDDDILIGKYIFSKSGFETAQSILQSAIHQDFEYLIIDEIGQLELQGKGLEPSLSLTLNNIKNTKIILVVRDYLLDEVIHHYQLTTAKIINKDDVKNIFNND